MSSGSVELTTSPSIGDFMAEPNMFSKKFAMSGWGSGGVRSSRSVLRVRARGVSSGGRSQGGTAVSSQLQPSCRRPAAGTCRLGSQAAHPGSRGRQPGWAAHALAGWLGSRGADCRASERASCRHQPHSLTHSATERKLAGRVTSPSQAQIAPPRRPHTPVGMPGRSLARCPSACAKRNVRFVT